MTQYWKISMPGCRDWIRDENGVAAFRCGNHSNNGLELCAECEAEDKKRQQESQTVKK